jgi:hypothetical protein
MSGGRWLPLGLLAVAVGAASVGCFWLRRPYADDPLVRRRHAPRGEQSTTPGTESPARPMPPAPPNERKPGVDVSP